MKYPVYSSSNDPVMPDEPMGWKDQLAGAIGIIGVIAMFSCVLFFCLWLIYFFT